MNADKKSIRPNIKKIKPYVPGESPIEAEKKLKISGVVKLASNENPLGPSKRSLEAINKYAKDVFVYPDKKCSELKKKIAKNLGLPPENIVAGNGSDEIMLLTGLAYLSAGEEVIISKNTFAVYELVTRLMDGEPVFVDLKDNTYDLEAMAKAITKKTKLIFVCNPNNPTGTMNTKNELDTFMSKVPSDVIVVLDEAYGEYVGSKDYPDGLEYVKAKKNVIVLRTFSKIYGLAGIRVGYGIASPETIKYLDLVRLPFSVNRIAQHAAIAALEDRGHVARSIKVNSEGKDYLYKELGKLGMDYIKTEANFICINVKTSADVIFMDLMRRGVIVRPLTTFGMPKSIRVTIGTQEQNQKFIEALKQVSGKG
ncbi:histidinol-phosphate transaminase [Candidatus Margulisiibacteriota bacterium]